jgi:excinuclease ABC subunit C
MILEGKKKNLVKKMEREMKILAKNNEYEKAAEMRNKIFALQHIQDIALITREDLSESLALGIPRAKLSDKLRIEAYDISNISGQHATGGMVVFSNGEPDKSQYRKFKIKTIQGADDVGMMREVLLRRFKNEWPQPDLIFLDGGRGHANIGAKILRELGFSIPLVAVAKGKSRKNLNFQFSIFNQFSMTKFPNEIKKIIANKKLVKHIMDEAHRFAIEYHKKLRKNSLLP